MAEARNTVNVPVAGSPRFERDAVLAISRLKASMMSPSSAPAFQGLTLTGLTASQLVATDADKAMQSIAVGTGLDMSAGTLSFSHLGLEDLTDPGGDRIFFWDDSEDKSDWLSLGNSLAITTTTLDTIQDIRTSASPTFAGITITNAAVLGSNSIVFQPNADAVTFLQVKDADGGTPILNIDSTNERVGIGTAAPSTTFEVTDGTRPFSVSPSSGTMILTGTSATWGQTPKFEIKFNGDSDAVYCYHMYQHDNFALLFDAYPNPAGGPNYFKSSDAGSNFALYKSADKLIISYNSGTAKGSAFAAFSYGARFDVNGRFGVGTTYGFAPLEQVHVTDTVRADTAFNLNGTDGLSGTLTLDDGANWRITLTFSGGILTGQTTGASSAATASWA